MNRGSAVAPAVVGTLDAAFLVERIGGDAEDLFELPACEIVGMSLLELLAVDHIPACLAALAAAVGSRSAVNLQLGLRAGAAGTVFVQAAFHPLQPTPGCAFVFYALPGSALLRGLTSRECEIVTRLRDGDRVPAIAVKLFLSQSTVRNHLASVFAKLGVASQQELLDSFR
jgi:DNA-binding CsgD family transcriptional regulator